MSLIIFILIFFVGIFVFADGLRGMRLDILSECIDRGAWRVNEAVERLEDTLDNFEGMNGWYSAYEAVPILLKASRECAAKMKQQKIISLCAGIGLVLAWVSLLFESTPFTVVCALISLLAIYSHISFTHYCDRLVESMSEQSMYVSKLHWLLLEVSIDCSRRELEWRSQGGRRCETVVMEGD